MHTNIQIFMSALGPRAHCLVGDIVFKSRLKSMLVAYSLKFCERRETAARIPVESAGDCDLNRLQLPSLKTASHLGHLEASYCLA